MRGRNHTSVPFVATASHNKDYWKDTSNQFMIKRNHTSVQFVITELHKREIWKSTLTQFMREKNHTSAPFVTAASHKKEIWKHTLFQFMKERVPFVQIYIDSNIVLNHLNFVMKTMFHENSNATSKIISSHCENDEMYTFLRVKNLYDDYWSMPNIWPRILLIFFETFSLWKNCYIPQSNWFSFNFR